MSRSLVLLINYGVQSFSIINATSPIISAETGFFLLQDEHSMILFPQIAWWFIVNHFLPFCLCKCFSLFESSTKLLARNCHFEKQITTKAQSCKVHDIFRRKGIRLKESGCVFFNLKISLYASKYITWLVKFTRILQLYQKTPSGGIFKNWFLLLDAFHVLSFRRIPNVTFFSNK